MREDRFRGHPLTAISAVQKALRDELDVIEHFEMEYKMDDVEIEPDVSEHFEMEGKKNDVEIEPDEKDWPSPVFEPQLAEEETSWSSPVSNFQSFGIELSSNTYPKKKRR